MVPRLEEGLGSKGKPGARGDALYWKPYSNSMGSPRHQGLIFKSHKNGLGWELAKCGYQHWTTTSPWTKLSQSEEAAMCNYVLKTNKNFKRSRWRVRVMLTLGRIIWLSSRVRQDEVTNSSPLSPSAAYSWESSFAQSPFFLTSSYPESWSSDLELRTIDLLACAEADTQASRLVVKPFFGRSYSSVPIQIP